FLLPPPPSSTPFPYATLFRSCQPLLPAPPALALLELQPVCHGSRGQPGRGGAQGSTDPRGTRRCLHRTDHPVQLRHPEKNRITIDRKSTRLNSSHVKISYAVF